MSADDVDAAIEAVKELTSKMSKKSDYEKFTERVEKELGPNYKRINLDLDEYKMFDFYHKVAQQVTEFFDKDSGKELVIAKRNGLNFYGDACFKWKKCILDYHKGQYGININVYYKAKEDFEEAENFIEHGFTKTEILKGKCTDMNLMPIEMNDYDTDQFLDCDVETIDNEIVNFFKHLDHIRANGMKKSKGLILYGEPGNGKTTICRYVSKRVKEFGTNVVWVSSRELANASNIRYLYDFARFCSPCLVIVEDADKVLNEARAIHQGDTLGEFLYQLDGPKKLDGVVTIISTNYIHKLDPAVSDRPGRFDLKMELRNKLGKNLAKHFNEINTEKYYKEVLKVEPPKAPEDSKKTIPNYCG